MDDAIIIIPARMGSKRLPGKPLIKIGGIPLLRRVYHQAVATGYHTVVSSSDSEIWEYCREEGIDFRRTIDRFTGTHRCAETLESLEDEGSKLYRTVINWQVDEPCVRPGDVNRLIRLVSDTQEIGTLAAPLRKSHEDDIDVVKTRVPGKYCTSFTRGPLNNAQYHVGVYGYPGKVLHILGRMKPTRQSMADSLEQIAWLEAGYAIRAVHINYIPTTINSQRDINRLRTSYADRNR